MDKNNRALIWTSNGEGFYYDSEGNQLAEIFDGAAMDSTPALSSNGNVIIGDIGGSITSYNPLTGAKSWTYSTPSGEYIESSPTIGIWSHFTAPIRM